MKREGIILLMMLIIALGCIVFYFLTKNALCSFIGYSLMLLIQIYRFIDIKRHQRRINAPENDPPLD